MKIEPCETDRTKDVHFNLTELSNRVYVNGEIWVSTTNGVIKVGVVNGAIYQLDNGELSPIREMGM